MGSISGQRTYIVAPVGTYRDLHQVTTARKERDEEREDTESEEAKAKQDSGGGGQQLSWGRLW